MDLLTAAEVAKLCGVSRQTVQRWVERGRIAPAAALGGGEHRPAIRLFTRTEAERVKRLRENIVAAEAAFNEGVAHSPR